MACTWPADTQVCGGGILEALTVSLAGSHALATASPLLHAIVCLTELSALLGLEELCESCAGALSNAASLPLPAPYGSQDEAKQQAALAALLGLGAGPLSALLGSAWSVLLRATADLDALAAALTAGAAPVRLLAGGGGSANGGSDTHAAEPGGGPAQQPSSASAFGRVFQIMGLGTVIGVPGAAAGVGTNGGGGGGGGAELIAVPPRAATEGASGVAAVRVTQVCVCVCV